MSSMILHRQRVFGINNTVRRHYRIMRRNGFTPLEARLMCIGACVTTNCKFYDDPDAMVNRGEWSFRRNDGAPILVTW